MDAEDLLEEPYGFGQCAEETVEVLAHCEAWKEPDQFVTVTIQKEGSRHIIHFHEFLASSKLGILTSNCDIVIDMYYPLADPADEFKISKCRSRHFCGSMQVYDEQNENELMVRAAIDYNDTIGEFTFEPVTNFTTGKESKKAIYVFDVGILPTTIVIDELYDGLTDEQIKELVPEEDLPDVPDIDMDYEDQRNPERPEPEPVDPEPEPEDPVKPVDPTPSEPDNPGTGTVTPTDPEDPTPSEEEETTEMYSVQAMCGVWENPSSTDKRTKIILYKKGTTGAIKLQSTMYTIAKGDIGTNRMVIAAKTEITNFFKPYYIPAGALAYCSVYTYLRKHNDTESEYKEVSGVIYFAGGALQIVPEYSYWKFFEKLHTSGYPPGQFNVGLSKDIVITFELLTSEPEYTALRSDKDKLDVSVFNSSANEDQTKNYKAKKYTVNCGTWGKSYQHELVYWKQGNIGYLLLPNMTHASNNSTASEISIKANEIESYFSGLPSGVIGNCKIMTYLARTTDDSSTYYQEVDGIVYYYNNYLHIVPRYDVWNWFFGPTNSKLVEYQEVGLATSIRLEFDLLKQSPTYVDLSAGLSKDVPSAERIVTSIQSYRVNRDEIDFNSLWKDVDAQCGAWETTKKTVQMMMDWSEDETKAQIRIENLWSNINVDFKGTADIVIGCADILSNYYKVLPPVGVLGYCDVMAYVPTGTFSEDNYKNMTGMVFFYNNAIRIVPYFNEGSSSTYVGKFYGLGNESGEKTQLTIGLEGTLTFSFTIPKESPSVYYNPSAYMKKFNFKADCYSWDIEDGEEGSVGVMFQKWANMSGYIDGEYGYLILEPILQRSTRRTDNYEADGVVSGYATCLEYIASEPTLLEYFGRIPQGVLGKGNVGCTYIADLDLIWTENHYATDVTCQVSYYKGQGLRIHPIYQAGNGIQRGFDGGYSEHKEVGIAEQIICKFKIPTEDEVEIEDPLPESQIIYYSGEGFEGVADAQINDNPVKKKNPIQRWFEFWEWVFN